MLRDWTSRSRIARTSPAPPRSAGRSTAPAATSATLEIVPVAGTSVTVGSDGMGLISYRDESAGDLKVAHCADPICSTADIATVDAPGDVGRLNSVTIGADGLGLISYLDSI